MSTLDIESLYTAHRDAITWYVKRRAGWLGETGVEDLVSLVFEKAIRGAGQWKDMGFPPKTWLYRIAHNAIVDEARTRRAVLVDLEHAAERADATDEITVLTDRLTIDQALAEISPTQQAVLTERFLHDQGIAATAAAVGRSEDAVRKLQQRGLAAMRRVWDQPTQARPLRPQEVTIVAAAVDTRVPVMLADLQDQERQIKREMRALQDRLIEVSGGIKVLRQLSMPAAPTEISTVERAPQAARPALTDGAAGKRWARNHDACTECGTDTIKHLAGGLCRTCYPKSRKSA